MRDVTNDAGIKKACGTRRVKDEKVQVCHETRKKKSRPR